MTDNLFDDGTTEPELETPTEQPAEDIPAPAEPEEPEPVTEESEEEGDKTAEGTPPPAEEEKPVEKLIPEHQFKAALKNVTDRLEQVQRENAQLKSVPAPDREKDPAGYEQHVRIETSKEIMMATHSDYDEMITHYAEMAKANPALNEAVAKAAAPAKFAYDLAKRDLEIRDVLALRDSEDWKQFQEWRKTKQAAPVVAALKVEPTPVVPKKTSVPNLNRSTDVSRKATAFSDDADALFKGAL